MIFSNIIKNNKSTVFPKLGFHQQNILSKIEKCRTEELGGHLYICEQCDTVHLLNNSCSNRNCPVCQGNKRKRWIDKQCQNLVNVPYYHVVFTIPEVLNSICLRNQRECYNILYHSAWNTLKLFFKSDTSLSGNGGMLCILHTWGQNLSYHPHLHCLVPGGGISENGNFKVVKGSDKFLFNVKNMAKVFRAKFAEELTKLHNQGTIVIQPIIRNLMFKKNWVVFAQRPFSTPENVVRYIGMYSHRVAISENRIIDEKDGYVSFFYKDYRDNGAKKIMKLPAEEFLRRFSMHIIPHRFMKIRYFGILNNRNIKKFVQSAEKSVGKYANLKIEDLSQTPDVQLKPNTEANVQIRVASDNSEIAELDYGLDDEKILLKKNVISCSICKTGKLRKIASFCATEIKSGILVVNINTSEILFDSRADPFLENYRIINIEI